MTKEFSKFEIAAIKRTAQNCYGMVVKRNKLEAKIAELQEELNTVKTALDAWESPIVSMTGYTTDQLVKRVPVKTGVDTKTGKDIIGSRFELIYPETVIPCEETVIPCDEPQCPAPEPSQEEVEKEVDEEIAQQEETEDPIPFN